MKHLLVYILMFAFLTSCIPLSFAPNIKTDKVKLAKRFKRDLPKHADSPQPNRETYDNVKVVTLADA